MYFDAQIVPDLASGTSPGRLLCPVTFPHHSWSKRKIFLPRLVPPLPWRRHVAFFSKKHPFTGEWSQETKIWVLAVPAAPGKPLVLWARGREGQGRGGVSVTSLSTCTPNRGD